MRIPTPNRIALGALAIAATGLIGGHVSQNADAQQAITPQTITSAVTEGFVDNDGVKIHYATLGQGPLVVLIHGHPDFWYGWRNQMPALARKYQVVAIDQRGIAQSDQPKGAQNYGIQPLVSDVVAVIRHFKRDRAIIVGHDTGAAIAWAFATALPQMTERLVTLSLPHPQALARARATDPAQGAASRQSLALAQPGSAAAISSEQLLAVVNPTDPTDRARYADAFRRTSMDAFVGYFQANLGPGAPDRANAGVVKVKAPVLAIHGLRDPFVLSSAYDRAWEYADGGLTLVMLPNAGHFPQTEAPEAVTNTIMDWLSR